MFRKLDDSISVAGQVTATDLANAADHGFTTVINNRPDGEEPGQPSADDLALAAQAAGLGYTAIPITHAGIGRDQIDAMRQALDAAPGPVLAFCRSGTRSTFAWALARAAAGDDPEVLSAKAAGAGYDLTPIRRLLG